ncbi:CobW/HypB/UreG, nucleotide-binding domain-containing protein [Halteromyces radiatus]|uniref:CobW/HypB/UreG, nucleotide-binding domain-containing protein n=1 Tax=Halteromyces radiatus TaxID=101107 RepID=UPI00221F94D6|nr:CobW/HypB/UreG, nucleotide-binding domain-containing protein [Halteromyces radiatus]KAI8079761.1 CobW/HypB/UreG, nucleotide-binding domain-containing protein [Halteromyces radiatus]
MTVGKDKTIPITVFTGFLGSGKTTTILSLLKRLPEGYKTCLLKNEFGDIAVDSQLAKETNIGVQEMMNGCLCCVLVGQMKLALQELKDKYNPDRIIVETSGSAFPGPVAWQIREMEPEGFVLDSIITVVDCVNFTGYEDTSYTAKLQAQYSDVILLNKHELVSERELDIVLDHVNELNTDTPKVKCDSKQGISPDLVFGLDTELFKVAYDKSGNMEEMIFDPHHQENEVDLIQVIQSSSTTIQRHTRNELETWLTTLPKDDIYRVKGFVRLDQGTLYILNHAFGRFTLTPVDHTETLHQSKDIEIKITVMGQDLRMYKEKIQQGLLKGTDGSISLIEAHRHH